MDDNNSEPRLSSEPIPPVDSPHSSSADIKPNLNSSAETPAETDPAQAETSADDQAPLADDSEPSITEAVASAPDPFRSSAPAPKKSPLKPILISAVLLLLVGVGVFAVFKYKDALSSVLPGASTSSGSSSEIIYSTPPDSTDPVGDYVSYLEKRISSASTPIEKLSATLDLADFLIRNDQAPRAVAILDSVSTSDFGSDREFYAFYSAYKKAYSPDYLNNPDLFAEYSALAEQYNPNPVSATE